MTKQFRDFEDSREFVRRLGLKSVKYWMVYCKSGNKPDNIPSNPNLVYKNDFKGMGDFLGTGTVANKDRTYRPFKEAREFARALNLKGHKEWQEYCKSGEKPDDIPSAPNVFYEKEWNGMHDWLGYTIKQFRPFTEAREFVQSLGLKNQKEWNEYYKSGEKPDNIPANPSSVYKEWEGLRDWLGPLPSKWKSFDDARYFIHSLNMKKRKEWSEYCKSGEKPDDIPIHPQDVYKEWTSWDNWIGYGKNKWKEYSESEKFARSLGLTSGKEWDKYCKSGEKPNDIPSSPKSTYKNKGWVGWGSFLGTGNTSGPKYLLSFVEAREFVRTLGLKGNPDWEEYCESGNKPDDIPLDPSQTYKNKGYTNMRNWVGNEWRDFTEAREFARALKFKKIKEWSEYCASGNKPDDIPSYPIGVYKNDFKGMKDWLGNDFRPFKEAREFARTLNLKGQVEWYAHVKLGNKPDDIPSNPESAYRNLGWLGYGDFLGTGTVATRLIKFRPFKEAREFVRSLRLKNYKEWKEYVESGNKPDDIPSDPRTSYKKIKNFELSKFRDFVEAREFVRKLGLKGNPDWEEYCGSGNKPDDIPLDPSQTYKNKGYTNMRNWVGNEWRDFESAREFVRKLNLKGQKEWEEYSKSGQKPDDIPSHPNGTYKNDFNGIKDWLGNDWRPFKEAREFASSLNLKGVSEWEEYCKSGNKPDDIPSIPSSAYKKEGWKSIKDWLGNEKTV